MTSTSRDGGGPTVSSAIAASPATSTTSSSTSSTRQCTKNTSAASSAVLAFFVALAVVEVLLLSLENYRFGVSPLFNAKNRRERNGNGNNNNYNGTVVDYYKENDTAVVAAAATASSAAAVASDSGSVGRQHVSVEFVFFMGLEGTGHHLVRSILRDSPHSAELRKAGVEALLGELASELFSAGRGYMDAYCYAGSRDINAMRGRDRVSGVLRRIVDVVESNDNNRISEQNETTTDETTTKTIAINANGFKKTYMMSYPMGGRGSCGRLRSPRLDLLYLSCQQVAGARCRHVLLHRDPLQVVRSTTIKRQFNPTVFSALHLYTYYLHTFASYLHAYPQQTAGCIGLYGDNDGDIDNNNINGSATTITSAAASLWGSPYSGAVLRRLTEFRDARSFETYYDSVYVPPATVSAAPSEETAQRSRLSRRRRRRRRRLSSDDDSNIASLSSSQYGPYVESLIQVHRSVVHLCREQVLRNQQQQ